MQLLTNTGQSYIHHRGICLRLLRSESVIQLLSLTAKVTETFTESQLRIKYWFGTWILQTNRAKFNQNEVNPTCQLCHTDYETLKHFLLDCQELETVRKPVLKDFIHVCDVLAFDNPLVADLSLVQLLVDTSVI